MKPPIASTFLFVGLALTPVVRAQVEALDPSSKCLMLMRDDPQAQVLWSKMPIDVSKGQPLEILAGRVGAYANRAKVIRRKYEKPHPQNCNACAFRREEAITRKGIGMKRDSARGPCPTWSRLRRRPSRS